MFQVVDAADEEGHKIVLCVCVCVCVYVCVCVRVVLVCRKWRKEK